MRNLVLGHNGEDTIYFCIGQGKDRETILTIDNIKSGLKISREIYDRDPKEKYLLPLRKNYSLTKSDPCIHVDHDYSDREIYFQDFIKSEYSLSGDLDVDLDYWTPVTFEIDMTEQVIKIDALLHYIDPEDKDITIQVLERFTIKGNGEDEWEDLDINGASKTIGNHIQLGTGNIVKVLVHNIQNVDMNE